jgi:hypothetical protein
MRRPQPGVTCPGVPGTAAPPDTVRGAALVPDLPRAT